MQGCNDIIVLIVLLAISVVIRGNKYEFDDFIELFLGASDKHEPTIHTEVVLDGNRVGRTFDGIGAISGGGATSKLLFTYPPKQLNEILDFLFLPNYGASLQILKVEIGGDSQSTDGTEASHMHSDKYVDFSSGYEWRLMKEAKKRNPLIKLYGLPWVFPGWIGNGTFNPFTQNGTNILRYIVNWIKVAHVVHGLHIDYIGIWNERTCDITYIKNLRKVLDSTGFSKTRIVACDGSWGIEEAMWKDKQLFEAVDIIGVHYPGAKSTKAAVQTDKPLWCSEEYSAYNDISGGGCWARVLNEAVVGGNFTGIIAWNLISSYYDQLPYTRNGLMTANQPWSGHYDVSSPIWMTAHHTHFTSIGWKYLLIGRGIGTLSGNGTFVTIVSPDKKDLTIVIETMDPANAHCFYSMPKYKVSKLQTAKFTLDGPLRSIKTLHVWYSAYNFTAGTAKLFQRDYKVDVANGSFSMALPINHVFTITTRNTSLGEITLPPVPKPRPFPDVYSDDFKHYPDSAEPHYLTPQCGSWEVHSFPVNAQLSGRAALQMATRPPIDTCRPEKIIRPVAILGDYNWRNVSFSINMAFPYWNNASTGFFVGLRVDKGGCDIMNAGGVYMWLDYVNQSLTVTTDFRRKKILFGAEAAVQFGMWYRVWGTIINDVLSFSFNPFGYPVKLQIPETSKNGWFAVGTIGFGVAAFSNPKITNIKAWTTTDTD